MAVPSMYSVVLPVGTTRTLIPSTIPVNPEATVNVFVPAPIAEEVVVAAMGATMVEAGATCGSRRVTVTYKPRKLVKTKAEFVIGLVRATALPPARTELIVVPEGVSVLAEVVLFPNTSNTPEIKSFSDRDKSGICWVAACTTDDAGYEFCAFRVSANVFGIKCGFVSILDKGHAGKT